MKRPDYEPFDVYMNCVMQELLIITLILLLTAAMAVAAYMALLPTAEAKEPAPPIIEQTAADKLPGEDTPAQGFACLNREALGEFRLTAYCPCSRCCGKDDGITATGTTAAEGRTIAVDPAVIPYGSTVTLYYENGTVHTYTAEDCGSAIKDKRIDVYFGSHQAALEFGVQTAYVYVEAAE